MSANFVLARQEVVDLLDLRHAGGLDGALLEFRVPVTLDAGTRGDLALTHVLRQIDQFVCTLKQVHGLILEKYYPSCKENFTRTTCDNSSTWVKSYKITFLRAFPHSMRPLPSS
jgi:hypothetical protein